MPETPAAPTPPPAAQQQDYALDYARMSEAYANFCRVAGRRKSWSSTSASTRRWRRIRPSRSRSRTD